MLKIDQKALVHNRPKGIRGLYNEYAAMLLGYIFEIVKDRELAEEYLVKIFCDLSQKFDDQEWEGSNHWCKLQKFARGKLKELSGQINAGSFVVGSGLVMHSYRNEYLEELTDEQKRVFYNIYYYGKSITEISVELDKTEDSIRKTLKEAFAIMKKGGEN